jgi:aspartyl-tRNA(Asn)/glutamyl-tRNA(Gln) amidotransferase subunit C
VSKDSTGSNAFSYAMRPDELRPSLPHDEAMNNAPQTDGTFFKVPKVIER